MLLGLAQQPSHPRQEYPSIKNFLRVDEHYCTGGQSALEDLARLMARGIRAIINLREPGEHDALGELCCTRLRTFVWKERMDLAGAVPRRLRSEEIPMGDNLIAFAAVTLIFGLPFAVIYAVYRVRRLKTEERLAAIAKGVSVPFEPEAPQPQRSRRAGILLVCGGLGYSLAFAGVSVVERDALVAAVFGIIPIAIGIGYFIDGALVRRELHPSG